MKKSAENIPKSKKGEIEAAGSQNENYEMNKKFSVRSRKLGIKRNLNYDKINQLIERVEEVWE